MKNIEKKNNGESMFNGPVGVAILFVISVWLGFDIGSELF